MNKEETKPQHIVKFKREPIWFKANFAGRYNGIMFRVSYREFYDKELDDVIKAYSFSWPGRIPEDKKFAEDGIKVLFTSRMTDKTFDWEVNGEADFTMEAETEKLEETVIKELNDKPTQEEITHLVEEQENKERRIL